MPIVLNGSGTVTGISAGGLPDGIIQAADLASGVGGKILQVIQTVKKDKTTIQSASLTDITGMSVTITPSSASNKVLIRYSLSVFTTSNGQYWAMRLVRGSDSTIFIGDQGSNSNQTRSSFGSYMSSYVDGRNITQELLDSPNTTSATTYKLQAHTPYSASYTIGINNY